MAFKVGFTANLILLIATTFIIVVTCVNIGYYRGILYNENGPNNGVSIRTAQAAIGLNGFVLALALFYFIYKIYLIATTTSAYAQKLAVEYDIKKVFDPVEVKQDNFFNTRTYNKYLKDKNFQAYVNEKVPFGAEAALNFYDQNSKTGKLIKPTLPIASAAVKTTAAPSGTTPGLIDASKI